MKIKTVTLDYEEVLKKKRKSHYKPKKPLLFWRIIMRAASSGDLKKADFSFSDDGNLKALKKTPCLILMNHSSFIDLEIVSRIFYPRPYNIVCTSDGFVGKPGLMRRIGCIPTEKFVSDFSLIEDIGYALKKLHCSVLMYPEASYSFDGTETALPEGFGLLIKKLGVPVVSIKTEGAFAFDPLYNCLQKRNVKVKAFVKRLFSAEEISEKSVSELSETVKREFSYDHFRWQKENGIKITEPFRADGLNRILYKCANCFHEGDMEGKRTGITCRYCGKHYEMNEYGELEAEDGNTGFSHIPDWYKWQRSEVVKEIEDGKYRLDTEVDIGVMVDYKAIYMVGKGRLVHTPDGFTLTGCGGKLQYTQSPLASYGLYSDYYWYELGDVICIGNKDILYYCFPKQKDVVAKTRMAAEEIYKIKRSSRRSRRTPSEETR